MSRIVVGLRVRGAGKESHVAVAGSGSQFNLSSPGFQLSYFVDVLYITGLNPIISHA